MSSPGSEQPVGLSNTPFVVRERKDYSVNQWRYRHDQALWRIGELAMFVLMWKVEDFKKGYVRRCPRCYSDKSTRASNVYNQATQNECPMCYGTTFEGGVRAKIIRPTLFGDVDDQELTTVHGTSYPQSVSVETTEDFRYRNGDYVFRADGSRWQLAAPSRTTVRTGFGHPTQENDSFAYGPTMATLEDETTIVWKIPPTRDELETLLITPSRYPVQQVDLLNGPLIPEAFTD